MSASESNKRSNQSHVWEHMEKLPNDKVQCKLCSKQLVYGKGSSTTSLSHHLRSMHPTIVSASATSGTGHRQQPLSSFGVGPQRPCNDTRQEKITTLLIRMVVANMLPLSLVDNEEFREFVRYLEPNYKIPCRQTVTTRLDSIKSEVAKTMKDEIRQASAVHVTTDIWSSLANDSYLGVTVSYINDNWELKARTLSNAPMEERHTQPNISVRLQDVAQLWGMETTLKTVVHDGASNMREVGSANNWTDVGCSAHKLHLCVTGAMGIDKVTNSTISKCVSAASRLVGHFSHSPLATTELNKRQEQMNITGDSGQPLHLVQHVKTRWNSVYDMFARLVKLR